MAVAKDNLKQKNNSIKAIKKENEETSLENSNIEKKESSKK